MQQIRGKDVWGPEYVAVVTGSVSENPGRAEKYSR